MDISIIVPLYQGRQYIRPVVEMVEHNQEMLKREGEEKEAELIFVNDFPGEEIKEEDFPGDSSIPIQIVKNPHNLGIHESRFLGLSKAQGSYIVFLDQDDEISPLYLYRQLKYIGQADVVICNGTYRGNRSIYKDEKHQRESISKRGYLKEGNYIVSPGQAMIRKTSIPGTWKKNILKENGSDDVLLWLSMLDSGKIFAANPHYDYTHKEGGHNTSYNFKGMEKSAEEVWTVIKNRKLLAEDYFAHVEPVLWGRIEKHKQYEELFERWPDILMGLAELCKEKKKIAIYGYGIVGKKLSRDLGNMDIKAEFFIDQAADCFQDADDNVYKPENMPEKVDFIIVTPLFAESQIKKGLGKNGIPVISLGELKTMGR